MLRGFIEGYLFFYKFTQPVVLLFSCLCGYSSTGINNDRDSSAGRRHLEAHSHSSQLSSRRPD